MKIPGIVRVGACDYEVALVETTLTINGSECYGIVDYNNHEIKINSVMGDQQQREHTFLHELLHAVVRERSPTFDDEELVVDELAKGLHQIIRDNPEIFL